MSAEFSTLAQFRAALQAAPGIDEVAKSEAHERNLQLTKTAGGLGELEDLAIWYAGWRGAERAEITSPQVIVFAGNHGIAAQGVSAFPPEVTVQMVATFENGGAAINQLSRVAGAKLDVIALSLDTPTADFTQEPAMSEAEVVEALLTGWNAVDETADVLVVGEMGIGNTTSAAAIANALFGGASEDWVGRGSGVDDEGLATKNRVVREGIALHGTNMGGLEALRCLGGREIAGMAGAIARARNLRIPVIMDGFICTAAAAVLENEVSGALDHVVAGHVSAEGAHPAALQALGKAPILNLGMRLGEGSGAAVAINVLKCALACHFGMSTFAEAGVSAG